MILVSGTSVWAAGDKVRGERGQGAVNQVDFDSQDNQSSSKGWRIDIFSVRIFRRRSNSRVRSFSRNVGGYAATPACDPALFIPVGRGVLNAAR